MFGVAFINLVKIAEGFSTRMPIIALIGKAISDAANNAYQSSPARRRPSGKARPKILINYP
ncbi:hypothetical protein C5750_24545 [Phyllobacterium myrsinacearum]|uniref:Uncharacterized protein n=1 Tax=Phyllobacterium myrsinacearum TaxID=28101 RepID=A0A2S9J9Z0_9HYPH|nr:hypothetical protein C5750_24545 [Phyllobacterium myrsinacearum]